MKEFKLPIRRLEDLLDEEDIELMLRRPSFKDVILNRVGWNLVEDLIIEFDNRRGGLMEERRRQRRREKRKMTVAHKR